MVEETGLARMLSGYCNSLLCFLFVYSLELKVMVLDIYNSKLDKRVERRKFIFERGLLEYKKVRRMIFFILNPLLWL